LRKWNKRFNGKVDFAADDSERVRGAYCIVCKLGSNANIEVGSLGRARFSRGVYVYIGSALQGIEQRVRRHRSGWKKLRWHIDYFLQKAEVMAVMSVPSRDKETECRLAEAMLGIAGASMPMKGFGSSDCGCQSHLVYLGDEDLEQVMETIVYRMSLLGCMYPESTTPAKRRRTKWQ